MKAILTTFLLVTTFFVKSQNFDWACSGQELSLNWDYFSMGKNNNLVVGGYASMLSYSRGEQGLYDANGTGIMQFVNGKTNYIISFKSNGRLNWQYHLDADYSKLCGLACDKTGYTTLLLLAEEVDEDDDEKPLAAIPEVTGERHIDPGYYLLTLDTLGRDVTLVPCDLNLESDLEVSEFKMHPNGNFVMCGSAKKGKLSKNLDATEGAGGGDFLLMIDSTGKSLWADAISYRETTCCAHSSELSRIAISSNGTIYIGGNYMIGAEFGKKIMKLAPTQYEANPTSSPEEAYVASYSPAGVFNWVITSGSRGRFTCIAANNSNVAIGFNSWKSNKVFGEKIDTTNKKQNVLCYFDINGKIIKTLVPDASIADLNFNTQNELVVLGTNERYNYKDRNAKRWIYAKDSLQGMNNLFLAVFNMKGELKKFKSAHAPVTYSNEPFRFQIGSDGNYYLCGQLFVSINMDLKIYDTAFKAGQLHGGAPFTARVLK